MAVVSPVQTTSAGIVNRATGSFSTDAGAAAALTFNLGFAPNSVRFYNLTDRITDEWISGMASASSLHEVATGVKTLELVNGIAVANNSFTVTAVTAPASKAFGWEAVG